MNTEQRVLKQIYEKEGKTPVRLIAKELGMNNSYINYLCEELFKKDLVRKTKRNCYKITRNGQRELGITIAPLEIKKKMVLEKVKIKVKQSKRRPKKKLRTEKKVKPQKPSRQEKDIPFINEFINEPLKERVVKKKTKKESIKEIKKKIKERFKRKPKIKEKTNKIIKVFNRIFRVKGGGKYYDHGRKIHIFNNHKER